MPGKFREDPLLSLILFMAALADTPAQPEAAAPTTVSAVKVVSAAKAKSDKDSVICHTEDLPNSHLQHKVCVSKGEAELQEQASKDLVRQMLSKSKVDGP